jgi:hypothetical protein
MGEMFHRRALDSWQGMIGGDPDGEGQQPFRQGHSHRWLGGEFLALCPPLRRRLQALIALARRVFGEQDTVIVIHYLFLLVIPASFKGACGV